MKAFERDAPWLYMNRKREISIPALGMFDLIKRKYISECFQKQSPGSVSKKKAVLKYFTKLTNRICVGDTFY